MATLLMQVLENEQALVDTSECTGKKGKMFALSANRDQKRHFEGPNFAPIV